MSTTEQKAGTAAVVEGSGDVGEVSVALTSREMLEALISDVHRELEKIQADEQVFVAA